VEIDFISQLATAQAQPFMENGDVPEPPVDVTCTKE
jgi:hypothetical protein